MVRRGTVNLPPGFNPRDKSFNKFANTLPTKELCDLNNPKEMFLWMLIALPGVNGGHQVMPSSYNMLVSEHLYQCGAMLKCEKCGHMKEPEKQYVAPQANDPHWLTSPGKWMKPNEVPKHHVDMLDKTLDKMTSQQQAALLRRLKERAERGDI